MSQERAQYTVVAVSAAPGPDDWVGDTSPPHEILERFEGRTFSLQELEERGVRIAGSGAYYTSRGRDWRLDLSPDSP